MVTGGSAKIADEEDTDPERDIINSVAPTLQWEGYTGTAYARTSLYDDVRGIAERTIDVGGWLVKEVRVWVCVMVSPPRSYIMSVNACDSVTRRGWW